MKVWLYYRLSRDEDEELNSLNNQRKIIYNFAVSNGHEVVGESFDDNVSGMHFNREGIDKIYEVVEAGKIEAIIVKDLSRLGRHRTQTALFIDYLREHDVRVLSATENIDTFNENDDLIIGFKGLVNDFYARDGSRRVRTGYRQKQKEGIVTIPPFGYFKDREGGTMARAKNRGLQQSFSPSYTVRRWRLGEYIRLSKEDLKKGKDDSNSVINQRDLLNDFYQKHIGEFESVSEYVDDGHTGTDANRENFQRLLSDVMSGKINCVVVKDLSRFARNYSDAGSLIDNLFVQMGVRFISLAENVDSYLNPDSVSSIIVPITNVMNDQYCYQTSKKIRQVFDYKRRNGQYIGAFAPYGYVKHPKDKHQLIIDPDAAEIVKLIFSLFLKGTSKRAIALYLNEHGVPSPSAYKLQKGIPVSTRGYDDPMWGARMIHSILTNPTYTGDLAQGRSRVKSYKVHEVESVPREEWVEVAGTHEAIIDYETFDKVQALLQRDTRTSPKGREVHLFSGFLKCADCGRAITRSVGNNNNVYYACSTYKNRSRTACTMHSIKHNRLEAAVLFAVQQQIHLAVSYSEMIARINTAPVKKSQSIRLEELIAAKERELAKISRYKQSLYQDWKDGEITQQDYRDMKADYERQTIALTDVLARLNAERAELANGVKSEHPALVAFTKHQNIDQLSRELLVELIDHIKVYENGNISVRFKFADEFRRIAEYIEINTTKPAVAG